MLQKIFWCKACSDMFLHETDNKCPTCKRAGTEEGILETVTQSSE